MKSGAINVITQAEWYSQKKKKKKKIDNIYVK